MATTTMSKKRPADRVGKRGAMSTPARPANREDSIHAEMEMRSAARPLSSVMRGLSTTARIRRPTIVKRNRATRPSIAAVATAMAISSSRLKEYSPKTS